jgi:hypothetical protein
MSAHTGYALGAYCADAIPPLPTPPKKRERIGEELLPHGSYAGLEPHQGLKDEIELLQSQDQEGRESQVGNAEWWNHERIRFLSNTTGLWAILLVVPYSVVLGMIALLIYSFRYISALLAAYPTLDMVVIFVVGICGLLLIFWVAPYIINGVMKGFGYLLVPFEKHIERRLRRLDESQGSEFNRQAGMVTFVMKEHRKPLVAPFVEFDGYINRVIQRGGVFYQLEFVHRYTGKQFSHTSFSQIVAHKQEVYARWDMLCRYMDVSQPLPDIPRLEPFRHLDPVTAEHDRKTGRDPRYWRDLDLTTWQAEAIAHHKAVLEYPWEQRHCQLTPQLGKVEMATYRERQQAAVA